MRDLVMDGSCDGVKMQLMSQSKGKSVLCSLRINAVSCCMSHNELRR